MKLVGCADEGGASLAIDALRASAPAKLLEHPRIGKKLDEFEPHEVRRILMGRGSQRFTVRAAAR